MLNSRNVYYEQESKVVFAIRISVPLVILHSIIGEGKVLYATMRT